MSGTVIFLPLGRSNYWDDAQASFAGFPTGHFTGEVTLAIDTGILYYWDSAAWQEITSAIGPGAVSDTDSIDLVSTLGVLSANLRLSADTAAAGFLKVTSSISADGLYSQVPKATAAADGYLAAADFSTFNAKVSASRAINTTAPITGGGNLSADRTIAMAKATAGVDGYLAATDFTTFSNKEPAVSAGAVTDYYRGDKSFQTLNVAALGVETGGAAAAASHVGEILTATQSAATSTGVGLTGVYGNATSISLTAGVWEVKGVAGFSENGANLTTSFSAGISSAANGSTLSQFDAAIYNNLISSTSDLQVPVPAKNINISSTTTYYLNTRFFYTSGSPQHYGYLEARRIR